MNSLKKLNLAWKILLIASFILPLSIAVFRIIGGNISFWHDPARDLLLALSNHEKLSLIGQISGIPGIFYGPYWIWMLSVVLIFFKDPRAVAFVILTLSYFTIFPYILYKFRKIWGLGISVMLWLFFAFSFDGYFIHIWNPHLAPLFALLTIYLATMIKPIHKIKKDLLLPIATGFSAGVAMNIHISFGLALVSGLVLYFLIIKKIRVLIGYASGVLLSFLPFFAFEIRHGFNQISAIYHALTSSSAVVLEKSNSDIATLFFEKLAVFLNIPAVFGYVIFAVGVYFIALNMYKKQIKLEIAERKLLLIVGSISLMLFVIYYSTNNPVWSYHFIGVEVLFLIYIGIIARKSEVIKKILVLLLAILIIQKAQNIAQELNSNPYKSSSLVTKQFIVDTIYNNSGGEEFGVFVFTNNGTTPDYQYLLDWRGDIREGARYIGNTRGDLVYLIIPWTTVDLRADFIDNRTPNEIYQTTESWEIKNGTVILKRELYEEN